MVNQTLETRIRTIENELAEIKRELASGAAQNRPASRENMFGIFAESEGFEEATRFGREYRESQYPKEDAEAA